MDHVLGSGWRLFVSETADAQWDKVVLNESLNVRVIRWGEGAAQECDGVVKAWFEKEGVQAALVRPDHIVFGAYGEARAAIGVALESFTNDQQVLARFFG